MKDCSSKFEVVSVAVVVTVDVLLSVATIDELAVVAHCCISLEGVLESFK